MEVKRRLISDLTLDPNNARTHSQKNLDAIKSSLTKFGQRKPIVVNGQGVILAGNGTVEAAKSLGWDQIDVAVVPADWDEATARAYALADNRTAELAEWDENVLAKQLLELIDVDFDIEAIGFEMPQVIEPEPIDEDEMPLQPEAMVKHGDLWKLGEHLLFCGDATEVGAYERLLGEDQVNLVWTDPPYGVSYVGQGGMTIENDNLDIGALEEFLRQSFNAMFTFTKPGACWYVAAPSGNLFQAFSIPLSELEVWRHTLVWVKDALVMGRADYHYRHESIFYGWTPGAAHQEPPDRKQEDPQYCDVIIARWEKFSGKTAELLPEN
jgi:hypothetical protein